MRPSSRLLSTAAIVAISLLAHPTAADLQAQAVAPAWVEEAIRLGSKEDVKPLPLFWNAKNPVESEEEVQFLRLINVQVERVGTFTTPFLRVAIAASEARKKLARFDVTLVSKEMLAPTLIVRVFPTFGQTITDIHRNAEHVVIKKIGSDSPSDAVQPTSVTSFDQTEQTLTGVKVQKQGLVATFPVESLREGFSFYAVYEDRPLEINITRKMVEQAMR